MKTNFKYNSVEEYDSSIKKVEQDIVNNEEKTKEVYEQRQQAIKDIEKKLEETKKPFDDKLEKLQLEQKDFESKKYNLGIERTNFNFYTIAKKGIDKGEFDGETVGAYLRVNDLLYRWGGEREITLKKVLKNGIQVFREYKEFDFRKYFFFYKTKLIAFWSKREGRHRGDDTYSQAWVGVKNLTDENDIKRLFDKKLNIEGSYYGKQNEELEKHLFYRKVGFGSRRDPTIAQFMKYVEEINTKDLVEINIDDKKTKEIISGDPE